MYLHFSASYYSQCSWLHTHRKKRKRRKNNQKADTFSKSMNGPGHVFPNKSLQNASAGWKHMKAKKMQFTHSFIYNMGVFCHHYFNH